MRLFDALDIALHQARAMFQPAPRVVEMYFNLFRPEDVLPPMSVERAQELLLMRRRQSQGSTGDSQDLRHVSTGLSTISPAKVQELSRKRR